MHHTKHRTTIRVIYGDTDSGGVVYYGNYMRYFEIGRTELMREWLCSYNEIEKMGFILPVIECWSRNKAPAYYDDLITVETEITELTKLKCKFSYRITRAENGKQKLLVKGYTVHAAVDREGKLTRLPEDIINKLGQFAVSYQD